MVPCSQPAGEHQNWARNGLRRVAFQLLLLRDAQDSSCQHQFLWVIHPFSRLSLACAGSLRCMLWTVAFVEFLAALRPAHIVWTAFAS